MKKMFALAGDTPEQAAKEAAAVMEIETAMAKASMSRTDRRQPDNVYHIYTGELDQLDSRLRLEALLPRRRHWALRHTQCRHAGLLQGAHAMLQSEPLEAWKSYLRWQVLHGQAEQLPKAFFDENFAFFYKTLSGQDVAAGALEAVLVAH